jgi:hypothetical protein
VERLCCEVINLAVPMRCDLKYGRNWADATHTWDEVVNGAATAAVIVVPSPPIASEPPDTCAIVGAILSEIPGDALASPEAGRIPATDTSSPPVSRIPWAGGDPSIVIGTGFDDQTPRLPDVIGAKGKILCPFHDDHSPSLHVYDDHYHCFVCGAHGDAIDWLRQVEGLSYNVAAEMLANWAGPLTPARGSSNADVENTRTLALAVQLWEQAQPIADTPALQYLAHVRKIDTDALPNNVENVLRFHPRCPFGTGNVVPCLIALFRDVETDAPAGIHRIAIPPEVFAGAKVQRMTLGRWPTARAIKLWPAQTRLFLGEGIETTLAAATRLTYRDAPMRPAWAAGSATNISKFPVLPGVEALMLLVDYDPAGESAAAVCHTRWRSAGRASTRLKPEQAGTDFNDLVISKLQEPS